MESKTAEELRKLDTIIFDMYENDEINDKQYMEIHGQIINVRLAVKDLIIPSVSHQRVLLESFVDYAQGCSLQDINIDSDTINYFLEDSNCG